MPTRKKAEKTQPKAKAPAQAQVKDQSKPTRSILLGKESFKLELDALTKHALISGVTGSGKTNTCFALLNQLSLHNISFLVVEPVKSEYRHLILNSAAFKDNGRVYTLGNPGVSPLRINPFEVPEGVRVQAHIDALASVFSAAFDLYAPLKETLKQSLVDCYRLKGWDLTLNENLREYDSTKDDLDDIYPTMQDLYESIEWTVKKMSFSESVITDVRGALEAVLGGLITGTNALIYLNGDTIPPHILFNSSAVIELQEISDEGERAFCFGVLLLSLSQYAKKRGSTQHLQHVLLIDDAHRMFESQARINSFFKNILSEIGAYGEGIVFSSQIPANLYTDIASNTSLKFIHRLLRQEDVNSISGPGFLNDSQKREMATLSTGSAISFAASMNQPAHCNIAINPVWKHTNGSNIDNGDEQLHNFMKRFASGKRDTGIIDDEYTLMVANDRSFRNLYNRFMLSFAKDYMQLVHFRSQIIREVQRILGGRSNLGDLSELTWRALVIVTHRYLQRKGEDNFWPHEEVRKLEKRWLKLLKMAFNPGRKTPKLSLYEIQAWRNSFLKMSEREQGPYQTCGPCQTKCAYRFEVSELANDPGVTFDFNTTINSEGASASENAAYFVRLFNERLTGQTDIDISYCMAVHLIQYHNLSTESQQVLLNNTRHVLEEREDSGS